MIIYFKEDANELESSVRCEHAELVEDRLLLDGERYVWLHDVERIVDNECEGGYGL